MPPHFPLHWFWPPPANLMPPLCLLQWHRVGFQPSSTGWLVEAGLLCANPPHVHQRPAGGPLDVIRQPPCPPLCLLPPLGGRLCSVQKGGTGFHSVQTEYLNVCVVGFPTKEGLLRVLSSHLRQAILERRHAEVIHTLTEEEELYEHPSRDGKQDYFASLITLLLIIRDITLWKTRAIKMGIKDNGVCSFAEIKASALDSAPILRYV